MRLRLLIVLVILVVSIGAADASAGTKLVAQVKKGMATTSRSATGSCGFQNNYFGLRDLLIVCRNKSGRAVARYDFYLPSNVYGKPVHHVFKKKLCCTGSQVTNRLVRLTKRHYRLIVAVERKTRLDVTAVSISYYVKT